MKKIFILNPPSPFFTDKNRYLRQMANSLPSVGICSLGGMMKSRSWTVSLLDAAALGLTLPETVAAIERFQPHILGISMYSNAVHIIRKLVTMIKARYQDMLIIIGGPHVSAVQERLFEAVNIKADFAVLGEGEITLAELATVLAGGNDVSQVPGILYQNRGRWQKTTARKNVVELDQLPDPAWELLPGFPHRYQPPIFSYTRGPAAPLITSRGCPYHCAFCDHSVFGYHYRVHSTARIVAMVRTLHQKHGVNHILFADDHLSLNEKRLTALCHAFIDEEIAVNWSADVRADSLSVEHLMLMKQAGCVRINCGIETGSPELLKKMKKGLNLAHVKNTLRWAHILGIQTKGLFMVGFPGENNTTIRETLALLKNLEVTEINVSKFAPYPGTPFYEKLRGPRTDSSYWRYLDGTNFCDPDLNRIRWLEKKYYQILHTFYARPRIINTYLVLLLKYADSRKRLFSFFRDFFKIKLGLKKGF
ncbi:B12-binding domain-containing radical SAM protein [candidate division CSSED10-310 bacterium]|uniref:B12-binding domain-containing radical SAM protein n=1 Tax=candidate division CSSED10-310 bacterium TaxID=2855610 RepID=A0ABV6YUT3_UNCC1